MKEKSPDVQGFVMRHWPRLVSICLLVSLPLACTEAPQFMKDEQQSGVVIFAGQFAQGSMFRDNNAPASAYKNELPNVAASPRPISARSSAEVLSQRAPRPAPKPLRAPPKPVAVPTPI